MVTEPVAFIRPGVVLEQDGKRYCVRRLLSTTEFDVVDVESGQVEKRSAPSGACAGAARALPRLLGALQDQIAFKWLFVPEYPYNRHYSDGYMVFECQQTRTENLL